MSKRRKSPSFTVKTSVMTADAADRGEHLQRFADRLIAYLDPQGHLGCRYDAEHDRLICLKEPFRYKNKAVFLDRSRG